MIITKEIMASVKKLNSYLKDRKVDIDEFSTLLKTQSEELGISYSILLQLTTNRDFLYEKIEQQVSDIEKQIEQKKKELEDLEKDKHSLGALVCELHGHNYDDNWVPCQNEQTCCTCGEKHYLKQFSTNGYLSRRSRLKRPFYTTNKET